MNDTSSKTVVFHSSRFGQVQAQGNGPQLRNESADALSVSLPLDKPGLIHTRCLN